MTGLDITPADSLSYESSSLARQAQNGTSHQMNTEERARLVDAGRMLNYFLEMDKKATESHIQLTPSERSATGIALCGIESVLAGAAAKAQAKVDQHKLDRMGIKCTDLALVLFDDKSKPVTKADANGKLIQVERDFEPYKPPIEDEGAGAIEEPGLFDEENAAPAVGEKPNPWKMPGKGNTPEVPENVKAGLIQALQDGAGRKKACELVHENLGIALFTIEEHFDRLVKRGVITKGPNRSWIADPGDEIPTPNSEDPDVLATSETPGQGLVATTEPADAQAA